MFSSLEEIAETKTMLDRMIGSDFEDPRRVGRMGSFLAE